MRLPIEQILQIDPGPAAPTGEVIGHSRESRDIIGHVLGQGPIRTSLIGGCHADEPVGPAMLQRLIRYLAAAEPDNPALVEITWYVVPDVNPDGAERNSTWSAVTVDTVDSAGQPDRAYDPVSYVQHVIREPPGDDIEFGFPRNSDAHPPNEKEARSENLSVANFLSQGAPFALHGSFHGMGFAPGPWFLIEASWIDRTLEMRNRLRTQVRRMQLPLFDIDRQGDKGFTRIDEGFCTRPDSEAMAKHFRELGDLDMANKFRPSSMEFVGSLGGSPLTLVSEMPLFLIGPADSSSDAPTFRTGTGGKNQLHAWIQQQIDSDNLDDSRARLERAGIRGMPIRDQMRLQLAFLNEACRVVQSALS